MESNRGHVKRIQRTAVREIRRFLDEGNKKNLPVTVSFSGGRTPSPHTDSRPRPPRTWS